ncbi:ABC transporter family substrate-binding protein [Gordonia sp. HY285]|uniref:ABC transporter family substrate-binding protein n=1 Tax=Gordonia liuliyuniae TaxID=2911517 RepID=UPI001F237AB6|nr:ABC transporter family substrate-binding protein [Gordonia liuliyuniae]MCF8610292.1 ABC transporter family substrate-binding protein [Gordonia liuliyuniae]
MTGTGGSVLRSADGFRRSAGLRRVAALAVVGVVGFGSTACMADPPPPVRETLPTTTPNEYPDERTVYVATDSIGSGFNPHIGSDLGSVTTAVAALTLPSAFLPVQTDDGVQWQRNDALLTSAEVTSTDPFEVTYKIVDDAQWSDGLPVTGDDFAYLWQQMSRQPNVVGAAGYRAVKNVETGSGGKVVTVTFAQPYTAWRELFTSLLPSHSLRSEQAGFQTGLDNGKPVTAGPFAIYSIDRSRDEVRLIRNDRYWRKPPEIDQVVLRRAGTAPQMAQTIRNGDSTMVSLTAGPASAAEVGAIPGVTTIRRPMTRGLTVNINTRSQTMTSLPLRRAILGMLDSGLIRAAAAGDTVVTPFANTVYAPSNHGYRAVDRARQSPREVLELLASVGYRPGVPAPEPPPAPVTSGESTTPPSTSTPAPSDVPGLPSGVAPISKDGDDLVVRIGAVNSDEQIMSSAETIADQLRASGVRAVVQGMSNTELYGAALLNARVDLVVGWTGMGGDPATSLASQVGCEPPTAGTEAGEHTEDAEGDGDADESVLPTKPSASSTSRAPAGGSLSSYTGNISGLCDPELMSLATEAMSSDDPAPYLTQAETVLADQAVYLPIYQDSVFGAATDKIVGVSLDGAPQVGVFGDAVRWGLR